MAVVAAEFSSEPSSEPTADTTLRPASAPAPAYALLIDAGFDTSTARRLATSYSWSRISRQCAWLPRRNPQRNKLGLLRKAIEEDWPEPSLLDGDETPAAALARGFYAALAGPSTVTATRPSAEDLAQAAVLLERVADAGFGAADAMRWGRDLAAQVRRADPRVRRAPGTLASAAVAHGEDFLFLCRERDRKAHRREIVEARRRHQERYRSGYLDYLRACRDQLRSDQPEQFRPFEEAEAHRRSELQSGFVARVGLTNRMLEAFDREDERLTRFWLCFAKHSESAVLDFWGWDEQHNPEAFPSKKTPPPRNAQEGGAAALSQAGMRPDLT